MMELEELALREKNKVMQAYINDKEFLHTFFDYENEESSYRDRLEELAAVVREAATRRTVRSFMELLEFRKGRKAYRGTWQIMQSSYRRSTSGDFDRAALLCT